MLPYFQQNKKKFGLKNRWRHIFCLVSIIRGLSRSILLKVLKRTKICIKRGFLLFVNAETIDTVHVIGVENATKDFNLFSFQLRR